MSLLPRVDSPQFLLLAYGRSLLVNAEDCDWRTGNYNQCTMDLTVDGLDATSKKNCKGDVHWKKINPKL